jgi:predicted deacetylase
LGVLAGACGVVVRGFQGIRFPGLLGEVRGAEWRGLLTWYCWRWRKKAKKVPG